MILGFQHFHPLNGECPNTFPEYGNDIAYRARVILKNRSEEDINNIASAMNWIIDHKSVQDKIFDDLEAEAENINNGTKPEYTGNIFTSIFALRHYQKNSTLPDINIQNLQWHEIYATLALTLLDLAIDDEKYYTSWHVSDEWLHDWRILSHTTTWLIESMEAITLAEGLLSTETVADSAKNKLRANTTYAAIQRHAKTNNAILALYELYQTGKYKSMRNAAQIFCENFPEKVTHLAHYNKIRTLSDGLSAHLKGKRRSLQAT